MSVSIESNSGEWQNTMRSVQVEVSRFRFRPIEHKLGCIWRLVSSWDMRPAQDLDERHLVACRDQLDAVFAVLHDTLVLAPRARCVRRQFHDRLLDGLAVERYSSAHFFHLRRGARVRATEYPDSE